MSWTSEAPTEPGCYWWRRNIKHLQLPPRILTLRKHPILGWAWHYGIPIVPTADGEWWPRRIDAPVVSETMLQAVSTIITPDRLRAAYRVFADKSSPPRIKIKQLLLAADEIERLSNVIDTMTQDDDDRGSVAKDSIQDRQDQK